MKIRCPICREWTVWEENPDRPFCSARCREKDIGAWASGSYRIEGRKEELEDEAEDAQGEYDPE